MDDWIIADLVDKELYSMMQSELTAINGTKQIHLQGRRTHHDGMRDSLVVLI